MDKYEYKIRSEEIKTLIGRKKYAEAMEIADMIDWRKVKNVNMLCTVSDLYKLSRRYEESREILLLAYERHPGGRMIIYSLCELCIKLDDVVQAVEYYKEFVQTAPRDNGRYVLQYKLYEAQEVTLEERIAVLEELKRREYREKWAYELAYLYHRIGLGTKCVEECDELILWFGEGKYVTKAMELKMLHAPLSPEQEKKYKKGKGKAVPAPAPVQSPEPVPDDDLDIQVKPLNVGEYATINLQRELAESMKEVLAEEGRPPAADATVEYEAVGGYQIGYQTGYSTDEIQDFQTQLENNTLDIYEEDYDTGEVTAAPAQEVFMQPQQAVSAYENVQNLHNMQNVQPIRQVWQNEPIMEGPGDFTREIITNLLQDTEDSEEFVSPQPIREEEVFFDDPDTIEMPVLDEPARVVRMARTAEIPKMVQITGEEIDPQMEYYKNRIKTIPQETVLQEAPPEKRALRRKAQQKSAPPPRVPQRAAEPEAEMQEALPPEMTPQNTAAQISTEPENAIPQPTAESMAQEKNEFDHILTQEYDGQIKLAVPAKDTVEKQITGQMSIQDVLLEWEQMKRDNEEKRAEAIRQRVMEQTGEIFLQFDASTKEGPLAELTQELPEVEELEEIDEQSDTQRFSQEALAALQKAVAAEEKEKAEKAEQKRKEEEEKTKSEENAETEKTAEPEEIREAKPEEAETGTPRPEQQSSADTDTGETDTESEKEKERAKQQSQAKAGKSEVSQRPMTSEEKKLFGPFIQTKSTRDQILHVLDHISLASYTGNVILTGEPGMGSIKLAKNIIKDIQMTDSNFSGRMAKITGQALNHKDMEKTFGKLSNGALIVEGAGEMKQAVIESMARLLEQEEQGIIVILEDTKINMNKLLDNHKILHRNFDLRIDIEAMDNDSLVLFGKKYALEQEYAIDELGVLALYTRISDLQTSEHSVTTKEVKEIVDEAIYHAGRKNMSHFMEILLGKRYDEEDMIILREKDFV